MGCHGNRSAFSILRAKATGQPRDATGFPLSLSLPMLNVYFLQIGPNWFTLFFVCSRNALLSYGELPGWTFKNAPLYFMFSFIDIQPKPLRSKFSFSTVIEALFRTINFFFYFSFYFQFFCLFSFFFPFLSFHCSLFRLERFDLTGERWLRSRAVSLLVVG